MQPHHTRFSLDDIHLVLKLVPSRFVSRVTKRQAEFERSAHHLFLWEDLALDASIHPESSLLTEHDCLTSDVTLLKQEELTVSVDELGLNLFEQEVHAIPEVDVPVSTHTHQHPEVVHVEARH